MAVSGTISSYNPNKGFGFITMGDNQDVFVHKKDCDGICPVKGQSVQFTISQSEKGPYATGLKISGGDEVQYHGEIKSFNAGKGYGFIGCEAFPDSDVFVLKSELPGGFGPQGGLCKFKVKMEEKGPAACEVQLLGAAGDHFQQMRMWGKGFKGFGKGKGSRGPRLEADQKVWIGNLPEGAHWKDLQEHMEKAGKIKWCEVFSGKGAGTGTVGYVDSADVSNAINTLNGSAFNGQAITVDAWVKAPKED